MTGGGQGGPAAQPCLFILFPEGKRPSSSDARAALARAGLGQVSYDPADEARVVASDWLELLIDGLTFDLLGLSPGRSLLVPEPSHSFGFAAATLTRCEAIGLAPGPHLAGAANALPIVRTLLRLASGLASQWDFALGTLWLPAGSAMRRDLFVDTIESWLSGGPFPAPGLVGVIERADGALASDGLAFFTDGELVLGAELRLDRVAATRMMARLIDHLVHQGPPREERVIVLEGGAKVRLLPCGPIIHVSPG